MRCRLRWVLPFADMLVCLVALWPARGHLLVGLIQAKQFYSSRHETTGPVPDPRRLVILPELTPEQERELAAAEESVAQRMRVPVVLNFPAATIQVPYLLITHREWRPQGMSIETWRALSWPFVGLAFWWLAGRGIEALRASFRSITHPRLNWIEVAWAVLLLVIGIVTVVGVVTSTPDDRRDKEFMALIYGGLLWGVLAALTVTAGLRQWRIARNSASSRINL